MTFKDRLRSLSVVDAAAVLVVVAAAGGVLWSPKLSNTVAKATGALKPVEVMVDVRNTSAADPDGLVREALDAGRTTLVIEISRQEPLNWCVLMTSDGVSLRFNPMAGWSWLTTPTKISTACSMPASCSRAMPRCRHRGW